MGQANPTKQPDDTRTKEQENRVNLAPLLGAATALMMESPLHQHLFISDMKWLLLPPLQLQQFRIFRKEGVPIGFISWAFLDEEAEERMLTGQIRLRPNEWNNGERLWLIDIVSPFGLYDDLIETVKREIFPGKEINYIQKTFETRKVLKFSK